MDKQAIGYIRVSSKMQGKSGLGLEAQQNEIQRFCEINDIELMDTAIEVQSAKDDISSRKVLTSALERCKKENCILIVSKLDRLSR
jgi:DNA invertase Pin-like site-specific DNA recombinase